MADEVKILSASETNDEEAGLVDSVKMIMARIQRALEHENLTVSVSALANMAALVSAAAGLTEEQFMDAMRKSYRTWEPTVRPH